MINTLIMKYSRLAALVVLTQCLTSCQTLGGVMNSFPVRLMDETASSFLGMFAENGAPADGSLIQQRAQQVKERGVYEGHVRSESSQQSVAAR